MVSYSLSLIMNKPIQKQSKSIQTILEKLEKKFPELEFGNWQDEDGKWYKYLEGKKEIKQFITTEIKELLGGLKGEEKENNHQYTCTCKDCFIELGSNERELKLGDDIDKIIG